MSWDGRKRSPQFVFHFYILAYPAWRSEPESIRGDDPTLTGPSRAARAILIRIIRLSS